MEREGRHIAINLGKRQMWFPILIENGFAAYTPWLRERWFSFTADKGRVEATVFKLHLTSKYIHWSDAHFGTTFCLFLLSVWFSPEMSQKKLCGQLRRVSWIPRWLSLGPCYTEPVLFMMLQVERVRTILPSNLLCPNYRGKTAEKEESLSRYWSKLQLWWGVNASVWLLRVLYLW